MTAVHMLAATKAERLLAETFHSSKAALPGRDAVAKWREEAFAAFCAAGLPHRRIESWHYTDLRALMRESLPLARRPSVAAIDELRQELGKSPASSPRIVLANGFLLPQLCDHLPEGLTLRSLASVLAEGPADIIEMLSPPGLAGTQSVVSLNAALMQDGVVIEVAPKAAVAEPIHLIYATLPGAPVARFTRSALRIGAGASMHLVERFYAPAGSGRAPEGQVNNALILTIGDGATLTHSTLMDEAASAKIFIDSVLMTLGPRARLTSTVLLCGASLMRRQQFLRFEGAGSQACLNGVSLLADHAHADTTLHIEHSAHHCTSRETFKYILDDEATGVFQGKVRVAPEAQKTDAKMLARAILLSDRAAMNSKPELEIFADDVGCGHGSTSGGLDKDQLFYLRTRGLPLKDAEALLLEAFAAEVIDTIAQEGIRAAFRNELSAYLSARNRASPALARGGD